MTVANVPPEIIYTYTGPKNYSFPFKIFVAADLIVVHVSSAGVSTTLALGDDYTVTILAEPLVGGTITVVTPATSGGSLTLYREVPYTQETSWDNTGPLDMTLLEAGFDRTVMLLQQMFQSVTSQDFRAQWRGGWTTSTTYIPGQMVIDTNGDLYACYVGHIATTFSTDLTAGYWAKVLDISTASVAAASAYFGDLATNDDDAKGSALIGHRGRTLRGKIDQERRVSPYDFGGSGGGTLDDFSAVQDAIDEMYGLGGGIVDLSGGRWLIDSEDLIIKDGVQLWFPGGVRGRSTNRSYYTDLGVIILNESYKINILGGAAGIKGPTILKKGLTNPTSLGDALAQVASFAGTAIQVGDGTIGSNAFNDSYIGDCCIIGFEYLIYSTDNNRGIIERVRGDGTNGIYLQNVLDSQHLSRCHVFPFFTAGKTWSADCNKRTGVAYHFDGTVDWGQADSCFSYGHATGFHITDSEHVTLVNCGADAYGSNDTTGYKGFHIEGSSRGCKLVAPKAASQEQGIYIDVDNGTTTGAVTVIGGDFWGNDVNDIYVAGGRALLTGGNQFHSAASSANVEFGAAAERSIVSGNDFYAGTAHITVATEAKNKVEIGPNNLTGTDANGEVRIINNQVRQHLTHVQAATGNTDAYVFKTRKTGGTLETPVAAADNTSIVSYRGEVYEGSGYGLCAGIAFSLRGAAGAGATPGAITFSTTNVAEAALTARWIINEAGHFYPLTDNVYALGRSSFRLNEVYTTNIRPGAGTATWTSGAGIPEGVVTATVGSLYTRTDGGANATLYVKESGTGNTGWIGK